MLLLVWHYEAQGDKDRKWLHGAKKGFWPTAKQEGPQPCICEELDAELPTDFRSGFFARAPKKVRGPTDALTLALGNPKQSLGGATQRSNLCSMRTVTQKRFPN